MVRTLVALFALVPTLAAAQCPTNFELFLRKFEAEESFRLAQIRFPLSYSEPDRDHRLYPDAPPKTRQIERSAAASLRMPLYPSVEDQRSIPLKRKITKKNSAMVVHFDKPESDAYSYRLHFSRSKACWNLVKVQDVSL